MATKKKVSTIRVKAPGKLTTHERLPKNEMLSKWTGVVALVMALASMLGVQHSLALIAIGLGGISVYNSVRLRDYQFVFLGVAAILIGLNAIWSYAAIFTLGSEISY